MKLLKSIAFILLSSMLAISTANAESDSKQQKKTQQSSQQKNKKDEKNSKDDKNKKTERKVEDKNKKTEKKEEDKNKKTEKREEDQNLKLFNESVKIKISQANIVADDNNKQALQLTYLVENKSTDNDIQALHWVTGFVSNKTTFFIQDMPAKFQTVIKRGTKLEFISIIPFDEMPENARKIFLSKNAKIDSVIGAKSLTFTDGKKIDIK